jgi:O-methyltransferase
MRFHLLSRDVERANLTRELRLRTLFLVAQASRGVFGDYAEVGVYKGRSALLLARAAPEKQLHLFDTFSGMPDHDPLLDGHSKGEFSDTSLDEVKSRLSGVQNVSFYPGIFPETSSPVADRKFAFAHFDCDLYRPCVEFIRFFWPRLLPGGALVFDDYDWPKCLGVKKAIDEAGLDVVEAVDYQAIVFKRP